MRTPIQRVFLTLAATLVAAVCGMLMTFVLESVLVFESAEGRLGQDSVQLLREVSAILNESHSVLRTMNAPQAGFCSDAEIASFRKLLFASQFLRDAGRIRNGKIECSAALGRENLPQKEYTPSATMPDGSSLYGDISPYQPHEMGALGQRIGESYVVLDPYEFKRLDSISVNRSATVIDSVNHQSRHPGRVPPALDGVVYDRNWGGRVGSYLMATRCAPHYPICMTTYVPIPQVMQAKRIQLISYTSLGGIAGALFGLAVSQLYRRNRSVVQQLRRAIARDKLRMVYQPIVNLASRRIVGAEALVRWTDEEGFAVGPNIFVKLTEERGFVGALTKLVVRHALHDFSKTLRAHPDFRLSVNVAGADLADPAFLPMLQREVHQADVPAQCLAIEITESSAVKSQMAIETIHRLREQGLSVHIDDFGTGYSSLSYLNDLSVDAIKIDRSFTQSIGTGSVIGSILSQILAIADSMEMDVIVEGIETEEQANYFANADGRILAQGWLFGHPVPPDEFHRIATEDEEKQLAPMTWA